MINISTSKVVAGRGKGEYGLFMRYMVSIESLLFMSFVEINDFSFEVVSLILEFGTIYLLLD